MAAFGSTAADFGFTRRSREMIARTRIDEDDASDDEGPSEYGKAGPSPAAIAYLASLRSELLPARDTTAAASRSISQVSVSRPREAPQAPRQSNVQKDGVASAARIPELQPTGKRFLSKAERRKEKKRKASTAAKIPAVGSGAQPTDTSADSRALPSSSKSAKSKKRKLSGTGSSQSQR